MVTKEEVKKIDETNINFMNDSMFKAVFRCIEAREVVARFLHLVTGVDEEVLKNAYYVGGEIPKQNAKEKGKSADVIVEIKEHRIIVEMNQKYNNNLFYKNTEYAFSIITEKTQINSKKRTRTILINIDNFNHYNVPVVMDDFMIRDTFGNTENDLYVSIHFILANLEGGIYNVDSEIIEFLKVLKSKNLPELKKKYKERSEYMKMFSKVEDLTQDEEFIGYYDVAERHAEDLKDAEETGLEKGLEKGRVEGIAERNIEIAKNMLNLKMDIDTINKVTGLSIEEIEKLRNQ